MNRLSKLKYLQFILDIWQDSFVGRRVQDLRNLLQAHSEIKSDTDLDLDFRLLSLTQPPVYPAALKVNSKCPKLPPTE